MTASWSGPRRGQPNTRSRRDPSRAWRAPLGSLLFAVLDVTDGGSRTVPLPSQPQPHTPEFAPGDTLALGAPRPDCPQSDAVLGAVEAWPGNANHTRPSSRRPASTAPARGVITILQVGTKKRCPGRTKKQSRPTLQIALDRKTPHTSNYFRSILNLTHRKPLESRLRTG